MGSWGITKRESDDGLDLLGAIVNTQLQQVDFAVFNVEEALEVVKADSLDRIRRSNRGCSAKDLVFYISDNFHTYFTQGALLIAECLADYYSTGELTVTEYTEEKHDSVDHHIKKFVVTSADLKILLDELQNVQNPEHDIYQSWIEDSTREKWLTHIQSVYQILDEHKAARVET